MSVNPGITLEFNVSLKIPEILELTWNFVSFFMLFIMRLLQIKKIQVTLRLYTKSTIHFVYNAHIWYKETKEKEDQERIILKNQRNEIKF